MTLELLETPAFRAHASLVDTLKDLLDLAEKGEIVDIVAAAIYADGHSGTWANRSIYALRRIGAAALLFHEVCAEHAAMGNTVIGSRPDDPAA